MYSGEKGYPDADITVEHKSSRIDLLYVTDRLPDPEKRQLEYGSGRSASVAFGSATVDIGDDVSWDQLVKDSQSASRSSSHELSVSKRIEQGRFPETPHAFSIVAGRPVTNPDVEAAFKKTAAQFKQEIARRLSLTQRKDVVIFIHGFNNSFDDAAASLAEIWHFSGRQGVPLLYTWPAAHGGLFGYFVDRESGEFTVFHLKKMLKLLASINEIENIHIIAHSRGTDVTTTALRELMIESRAAGKRPLEDLRIKNLILAAPDLDFGVMRQRLMAEKFGPAIGQITIYTAQTDNALNISESLMTGLRLGKLESKNFSDTERQIFASVKNVSFINVLDVGSFISHAYFLDSPSASSDLIRVLRDSSKPGSKNRPLIHKEDNFWEMPADYPNNRE
ncbi:alpha/beta hydrolase [Mariprofundus sp. NF]|uniref:alpha/beta hydrolase n=1 Tax=Mariprofundus sp. NF TaxID=2608716 RepID=UPI0019D69E90|nr:alpha/beta hydrolase [Mariprofundus sp. NF]